mmetsp:Transcript_1887/g.7267  ORF Transcript_1887/g.7267 Transcript_1887/m.7267 type:complete len:563 (+) Transcript_1887:131-1819(+)
MTSPEEIAPDSHLGARRNTHSEREPATSPLVPRREVVDFGRGLDDARRMRRERGRDVRRDEGRAQEARVVARLGRPEHEDADLHRLARRRRPATCADRWWSGARDRHAVCERTLRTARVAVFVGEPEGRVEAEARRGAVVLRVEDLEEDGLVGRDGVEVDPSLRVGVVDDGVGLADSGREGDAARRDVARAGRGPRAHGERLRAHRREGVPDVDDGEAVREDSVESRLVLDERPQQLLGPRAARARRVVAVRVGERALQEARPARRRVERLLVVDRARRGRAAALGEDGEVLVRGLLLGTAVRKAVPEPQRRVPREPRRRGARAQLAVALAVRRLAHGLRREPPARRGPRQLAAARARARDRSPRASGCCLVLFGRRREVRRARLLRLLLLRLALRLGPFDPQSRRVAQDVIERQGPHRARARAHRDRLGDREELRDRRGRVVQVLRALRRRERGRLDELEPVRVEREALRVGARVVDPRLVCRRADVALVRPGPEVHRRNDRGQPDDFGGPSGSRRFLSRLAMLLRLALLTRSVATSFVVFWAGCIILALVVAVVQEGGAA